MLIQHHAIVGAVAAAILYPLFGIFGATIIFLAAFLVDVDHYFIYIYRKKDFSLKNGYYFFRKVHDGSGFYPIFHMVEVVVILAFLSNYFQILLPFVIGEFLHISQDWFENMFTHTTNRNFFATGFLIDSLAKK